MLVLPLGLLAAEPRYGGRIWLPPKFIVPEEVEHRFADEIVVAEVLFDELIDMHSSTGTFTVEAPIGCTSKRGLPPVSSGSPPLPSAQKGAFPLC